MRKPYLVRPVVPNLTKKKDRMGSCIHCGREAAKDVLFKGNGCIVVEKYCDACLETEQFSSIMTFYEK